MVWMLKMRQIPYCFYKVYLIIVVKKALKKVSFITKRKIQDKLGPSLPVHMSS